MLCLGTPSPRVAPPRAIHARCGNLLHAILFTVQYQSIYRDIYILRYLIYTGYLVVRLWE